MGLGGEWDIKFCIANCVKECGPEHRPASTDASWQNKFRSVELLASGLGDDGNASIQLENELLCSILLSGRPDGEQLHVDWGCPGHTSPDQVCTWRRADRSDVVLFTHLANDAAWRLTCKQTVDEVWSRLQVPVYPRVGLWFFHRPVCKNELMDTVGCGGCSNSVIGGIVVEAIRS